MKSLREWDYGFAYNEETGSWFLYLDSWAAIYIEDAYASDYDDIVDALIAAHEQLGVKIIEMINHRKREK